MTEENFTDKLRLWQEAGQYDAIIAAITTLGGGEDYELTLWLALAYTQKQCFDEAIALLIKTEREGEHDPRWHKELGRAYAGLEQDDLALTQYEQSLLLDRDQKEVWQLLTECLQRSGLTTSLGEQLKPERTLASHWAEAYTEEERQMVKAHIRAYYGEYRLLVESVYGSAYPVDVLLVEPTEERPFYTLLTLGMGAHRMNVPEPLQPNKLDRAELLICLPPDWPIEELNEEWQWPANWLQTLAYLPLKEDGWLGWGHTVPGEGALSTATEQCAVILCDPCAIPKEASVCPLPDGNEINFYQLIPLYEEELHYKLEQGAEALFDRFSQVDHVVDLHRANTCALLPDKRWAIPEEAMKPLLTQWEGGGMALATDRIIVDGLPVGYMYREEPVQDEPTDSGWRFMAGDESEAYMGDAEHFGVYALNVLCNYDPEIMPFLDSPVGSAFYRDAQGHLQPDHDRQDAMAVPFAQRVADFWEWFVYYESLLQSIIAQPDQYRPQDVVALVSEGADRLAEDVQFNLSGDHQFTFVVDGDFCRFYLMPYVVAAMPEALRQRWTFWPWLQPADQAKRRRLGLSPELLTLGEMQVSLRPAQDMGKFDIRFYHQDMTAMSDRECYSAFYLLLELELGEAMAYLYVNDAQRLDGPETDMFPLAELGTKICARILEEQPSVDTVPLKHWVTYEREPEESQTLRLDVLRGETCYPMLVQQYEQNITTAAGSIAAYGAQAVFLTLDHGGGLSLAEQTALRAELAGRLEAEVLGQAGSGQELGVLLGGADGLRYGYIDILLYDADAFLAGVSRLLQDYPYSFYLSPFYQHGTLLEITAPVEKQ